MKEIFPEFYRLNEKEYNEMFDDCLFVFDTNVLLNLYRYSEDTSKTFLSILEQLKDRIWIPYHVGLEYHYSREKVILEQVVTYEKLISDIKSESANVSKNLTTKFKDYNKKHPSINMSEIIEQLTSSFNQIVDDINIKKENHPKYLNNDPILEHLDFLFTNKVGKPYDQVMLNKIFGEGEERYNKQIPPGYEDIDKEEVKYYNNLEIQSKYGDLIIWNQVIDKLIEENWKYLVFITDDTKKDWWYKPKGRTIGPRIELINEIMNKTNTRFQMYQTDTFMNYIKRYLNNGISDQAIIEVQEFRKNKENFEGEQKLRDLDIEQQARTKYFNDIAKFYNKNLNINESDHNDEYLELLKHEEDIRNDFIDLDISMVESDIVNKLNMIESKNIRNAYKNLFQIVSNKPDDYEKLGELKTLYKVISKFA